MSIAEEILGAGAPVEEDAYETIASEFLQGIEAKDKKLASKALKAFVAMYQAEPEEPLGDE